MRRLNNCVVALSCQSLCEVARQGIPDHITDVFHVWHVENNNRAEKSGGGLPL